MVVVGHDRTMWQVVGGCEGAYRAVQGRKIVAGMASYMSDTIWAMYQGVYRTKMCIHRVKDIHEISL